MNSTQLLEFAKAAKERADKATKGPWGQTDECRNGVYAIEASSADAFPEHGAMAQSCSVLLRFNSNMKKERIADNKDFVSHARTAVPTLADAVIRLIEENERLIKEMETMRPDLGYDEEQK